MNHRKTSGRFTNSYGHSNEYSMLNNKATLARATSSHLQTDYTVAYTTIKNYLDTPNVGLTKIEIQ